MNEFPADITSVIWAFILIILIWFGSHLWLVLKYKLSFLLSILKIYVFPWTERLKVGMHDIVFLPISDSRYRYISFFWETTPSLSCAGILNIIILILLEFVNYKLFYNESTLKVWNNYDMNQLYINRYIFFLIKIQW